MKIFFTCSQTGNKTAKYNSIYLQVLEEIKRTKINVTSTIEKTYLNEANLKKVKDLAKNTNQYKYIHDKAIRLEILKSDGVIIEASYPSFRLGFETLYALSNQKPVLVLSKIRNYAKLTKQPHFFGAQYTDFTLPDEIEKFIKHVKRNKLNIRFNLFVNNEQKAKLNQASKQFKISQSDYIRHLIDKDESLT